MARRLIHTSKVGAHCAVKIYRDVEWGEFVIQAIVNGKIIGGKKGGGSFESDKAAARSTAAAMVRELRKRPVCRGKQEVTERNWGSPAWLKKMRKLGWKV